MKKNILVAILSLFPWIAFAQNWVLVSSNDISSSYIDSESIKLVNGLIRIWVMHDFQETQKNGVLSIRSFEEIDCKEEKYRALQLDSFDDHMAKGKVISTSQGLNLDRDWRYVPAGTGIANRLNVVCLR